MSGLPESEYGIRRAAYDLKKFRAKGMVRKIEKSRRYENFHAGLRSLTALLVLRQKVMKPLLVERPVRSPTQPDPTPIDATMKAFGPGSVSFL